MADLNQDEIRAMGKAVGLDIQEPELTEVMYSLNALLEALDQINPPGLDSVEPLPIILPPAELAVSVQLSAVSSRPQTAVCWANYWLQLLP